MLYTVLFYNDPERYAHCERYWAMVAEMEKAASPARAYKPTHQNHPMVRFTGSSWSAYRLVLAAAKALGREYRCRFQKDSDHACVRHLDALSTFQPRYWKWPEPRKSSQASAYGAESHGDREIRVGRRVRHPLPLRCAALHATRLLRWASGGGLSCILPVAREGKQKCVAALAAACLVPRATECSQAVTHTFIT